MTAWGLWRWVRQLRGRPAEDWPEWRRTALVPAAGRPRREPPRDEVEQDGVRRRAGTAFTPIALVEQQQHFVADVGDLTEEAGALEPQHQGCETMSSCCHGKWRLIAGMPADTKGLIGGVGAAGLDLGYDAFDQDQPQ